MRHMQKYVAEFTGTFALVFIGCGACIAHHEHAEDITHVGVALAFGGVVMCMVYALGHISGAHINPAVTIAFAAAGRFPARQVIPYVIAQLLGALCASLTHLFTYGEDMTRAAQYGATAPVGAHGTAFLMEVVLTFILMLVIMAVATNRRSPASISGLAIGATVSFDCLAAGKCCGASMNPARSIAPALFAGGASLDVVWLYILAPLVGAVLAAWFYDRLRGIKPPKETVPSFESREQDPEAPETN